MRSANPRQWELREAKPSVFNKNNHRNPKGDGSLCFPIRAEVEVTDGSFLCVIAELVAAEFFDQGDKERRELNIEPADLMNREKKNKIPSMQVGFIDAICLQLYERGLPAQCCGLGRVFALSVRTRSPGTFCVVIAAVSWVIEEPGKAAGCPRGAVRPAPWAGCCLAPPKAALSPPQALARVSPDCSPLLDGCRHNRRKWQALAEQQDALVNGAGGPAPRS
ncbi:hypothetical protein QTO34_015036 [Cnephaeus nilssonii]|uniref:PDEase domain-containing protein n=1 Tax=Cnephaeus nilssonii TaxID=3371016 RepID=A0AA40I3F6_CNENI|nr:hypothetical protein QTO34_015036 [Eptesicus nilssonii]